MFKLYSSAELDLRGNNLSSLPDEFRNLEELKVLDLSKNKFEGLPTFIYDSTKLKTLYARENKISGKFCNIFILSIQTQTRANSVDSDQMPQNVAADQGLHCLPLVQQVL